ncbi:uncharacterized protein BDCG_01042 [Blastomyces dermatitidis ER-3]|uniref:Uncharacterized protein n=1 Tax=Ajellomyces dermatitidis (strain ER-3 / ATCC MYA-2586) TaxID=559297 RepID=A0ABP2EPP2_AJEDR|nr:uncharacterized protein BDCG_01042 [Blastomyces dermatitidis ER-3]EEQ84237.2 hypothetical protein BDCG_01042 [Blastomyces dermatitidis ER-3]
MIMSNKHLHDAAAVSMTVKKARLKAAVLMSCGSTAPIATSPPASLATVVVLLVGASVSSSSPAPLTAVATLPPLSANTVAYDPMWSFREEPGKSLISETVTLRSLICSSPFTAYLSPAQNAAELSLQSSTVSSSSLCEKALVQSLVSTATYLHYIKQLKKKRILYICFFSHSYYFHCICNNNFCLSILKQYRVRVSELQVLIDFIKAEEITEMLSLTSQQTKMSVSETLTVKNEFDESIVIDK